nr:MAG TPA: hypothetical protein [Caudoviricetes sp.]
MELKELLKTEVNSALLTIKNHNRDNGFFRDTIVEIEKDLNYRQYEPMGICKNVPFECTVASRAVAFVYKYDGEIYWCHMPETYYHHLLVECYGWTEAGKVFEEVLDS